MAMVNLGVVLQEGIDAPKDEERAAELFKRAADERVPEGLYRYAMCLVKGIGLPKRNFVQGMRMLEDAARLKHQKAREALQQMGG
jgi:TPR repeat protein